MKCPECGGNLIFDEKTYTLVCSNCGLVSHNPLELTDLMGESLLLPKHDRYEHPLLPVLTDEEIKLIYSVKDYLSAYIKNPTLLKRAMFDAKILLKRMRIKKFSTQTVKLVGNLLLQEYLKGGLLGVNGKKLNDLLPSANTVDYLKKRIVPIILPLLRKHGISLADFMRTLDEVYTLYKRRFRGGVRPSTLFFASAYITLKLYKVNITQRTFSRLIKKTGKFISSATLNRYTNTKNYLSIRKELEIERKLPSVT